MIQTIRKRFQYLLCVRQCLALEEQVMNKTLDFCPQRTCTTFLFEKKINVVMRLRVKEKGLLQTGWSGKSLRSDV